MFLTKNQKTEDQKVNQSKKTREDVTIQRQIHTGVKKYLAEQASKRAAETGNPYAAPTKDEIKAECKKRWQKRLDRLMPKEDMSEYFD